MTLSSFPCCLNTLMLFKIWQIDEPIQDLHVQMSEWEEKNNIEQRQVDTHLQIWVTFWQKTSLIVTWPCSICLGVVPTKQAYNQCHHISGVSGHHPSRKNVYSGLTVICTSVLVGSYSPIISASPPGSVSCLSFPTSCELRDLPQSIDTGPEREKA
jgi:hypothetical protein